MQSYIKIITLITVYFSIFLPFIYLRSFTVNSKAFRIFTIYLFFIGIIQISSQIATKVLELESNIFISHYYFIGQFIFLSIFYYKILKHKFIWFVLILSLLCLTIQYIFTPNLYNVYNQVGMLFSHLIIIIYALLYLYKALSEKIEFTLLNIGVLIYFLSSSLIFSSGNLVFNVEIPLETTQLLINLNVVLYFVFQILIFVEWWKNYSVAKSNS